MSANQKVEGLTMPNNLQAPPGPLSSPVCDEGYSTDCLTQDAAESRVLTIEVRMLPPSVNHQYIQREDGGKALTEAARNFRALTGWAARGAAQQAGWEYPEGARLELTIRLTFASKVNQDIDNRVKAAIDAVAPPLHFNDSCIDRIIVERAGVVRNRPRCMMMLRVLRPAREGAPQEEEK